MREITIGLCVLACACGSVDADPPGGADGRAPDDGAPPPDTATGPDAGMADGPVPLGPWSTPARIDSLSAVATVDSYPTLRADGKELFFISNREAGYEIWVSRRFETTHTWSTPTRVLALSDADLTESGVDVSDDGNTIWFVRAVDADTNWNLYTATRTGTDTWTTPTPIDELNTPAAERSPHVSSDGRTMYFSRRDASGNDDIHVATRTATGPWQYGHAVARLNSTSDEDSVTMNADESELYVDSRRDGAARTYRSTRPPGGGAWSVPERVVELEGGSRADMTPDGRYMVLARVGPDGSIDLYEARR